MVRSLLLRSCTVLAAGLLGLAAQAGVLPDDRADALWHRYDGGGVTIQGPSLLVRKKFADKVSVSANYYVDQVSSASIDVVTTASAYKEERTQYSVGADYLRGKTTYSVNYTNSTENDYTADTLYASIAQDMFGDLTTVTLSFSRGWDEVGKRGDKTFKKPTNKRSYEVDVSQIVTRNLIAGASFETITDEGFLNNPYRTVRYLDADSANGYSYEAERYPRTHTSNALSLRARYFLPWRAGAGAEYRFYTDTWGVQANTLELTYTQPLSKVWTIDGKVRLYQQGEADFYSDLFPRANFQNYLARDKELSKFNSQSIGIGATYVFLPSGWKFISKGSVSLKYDYMMFKYDNFLDVRVKGVTPGTEPKYEFNANVLQFFVSGWF
jgi:hypothetical protein